jgi:hypothetical protein
LPAGERGDVDRITATCRAAVGEDAFASAFDHGRVHGESEVDLLVALRQGDELFAGRLAGVGTREPGSCSGWARSTTRPERPRERQPRPEQADRPRGPGRV